MRRSGLLFASAAIATALPLPGRCAENALAPLKWKARPVVVLSDSRDDGRVAQQLSKLDGSKAGLAERDVKVLQESDPRGPLHHQLGVDRGGFAVVLVGKDGGVKKIWRDPVDPRQIFTLIDAMPMRRDEMNG